MHVPAAGLKFEVGDYVGSWRRPSKLVWSGEAAKVHSEAMGLPAFCDLRIIVAE